MGVRVHGSRLCRPWYWEMVRWLTAMCVCACTVCAHGMCVSVFLYVCVVDVNILSIVQERSIYVPRCVWNIYRLCWRAYAELKIPLFLRWGQRTYSARERKNVSVKCVCVCMYWGTAVTNTNACSRVTPVHDEFVFFFFWSFPHTYTHTPRKGVFIHKVSYTHTHLRTLWRSAGESIYR